MVQQVQWLSLEDAASDLGMKDSEVLDLCERWRERRDRSLPYLKADLVLGEWQISASSLRRYKMGRTQEIQLRKADIPPPSDDLSRRQKAVLIEAASAYQAGRTSGKLMDSIREFSQKINNNGSQNQRTIESLCRRGLLDELKLREGVVYMINAAGFRVLRQLGEW